MWQARSAKVAAKAALKEQRRAAALAARHGPHGWRADKPPKGKSRDPVLLEYGEAGVWDG